MLSYMQRIVSGRDDEKGASAVEYGLLVAAIAALIVLVVFGFGGIIKNVFKNTCNTVGTQASVATTSCN